ncbi:VWA domain-containing protein [uncultured Corynebacterium sp.]|uniref:VWA domain-containing protein n=1 Tax=uncultured Corynebacterium sp. TaxID=159447 RepID=UPI00342EA155
MIRKLLTLSTLVMSTVVIAGCSSTSTDTGEDAATGEGADREALRIVAATELEDLVPAVEQASEELGFPIELDFPGGTLENSEKLKQGEFDEDYDATWFATNRYVDLIGASGKLGETTKIATSPVVLGVDYRHAMHLGWHSHQPTWAEIGSAAASGQLTFGMTDPSTSNSGFSALVSVSTAYADTGQALTLDDVDDVTRELQAFLSGQTVTSGSSGWLKDAFISDPDRANALINYESVLHTVNEEDNADLWMVVPADGVVSADYPLSALAAADDETAAQIRELREWIEDHPEVLTNTYRRPVDTTVPLPEELQDAFIIEQPFPGERQITDALVAAYNNELRVPGNTTFVLDTSGSMEGPRLGSLKTTMNELITGQANSLTGDVSLRRREKVNIIPFDWVPAETISTTVDQIGGPNRQQLADGIDELVAHGGTGIYRALMQALDEAETGAYIPSIVLMTDGELTDRPNFLEFQQYYAELPTEKKRIPVFVILYGEANVTEMENLAALTGGHTFGAIDGDLDEAFKEIRAYQ